MDIKGIEDEINEIIFVTLSAVFIIFSQKAHSVLTDLRYGVMRKFYQEFLLGWKSGRLKTIEQRDKELLHGRS